MDAAILFRVGSRLSERDEYDAARRHFRTYTSRSLCVGDTVIGRYSALPSYEDLEQDLGHNGSRLINSLEQHRWIADFAYYDELRACTFESWDERTFPRSTHPGPFVVKGATNSKKHRWSTLMYAADRRAAVEVAARLKEDELVGRQGIIYRAYEPLVELGRGLNGLPFANEWRFFYLGTRRVAAGYYWSESPFADDMGEPPPAAAALADEAARVVARRANFFVLDVAEKAAGGWALVEVNDGQQSGLSTIGPRHFYFRLAAEAAGFTPRYDPIGLDEEEIDV